MADILSNVTKQHHPAAKTRRVCLQQQKKNTLNSPIHEIPSLPYYLTTQCDNVIITPLPTPPLFIRKASVPLIKPSLKRNDSDGSKLKSVRFNTPLAQVMHFYTPPPEEDSCDEEEDDENELEDAFLELFSRDSASLYHPVIQQHILDSTRLTLQLPNWPTMHPTKRYITQMVSLENLSWDNTRSMIKGSILVHNLAFQKLVTVRMSFNQWQTYIDIDATYKESSKGDALDRFTFEFVTSHHLSYLNRICHTSTCSLAVRYQVNNREFWDNNSEKNFVLQWDSPVPETQKKEEYFMPLRQPQYHLTTETQQLYHTTTQQQISAHFQLYLDRKKRNEERQKQEMPSLLVLT